MDRGLCCSSLVFCATSVIILTASDVNSGFLALPWLGFCQSALPTKETEIKVVDYLGFAWKCSFRIVEAENELVFKIGGGWGSLCKARRLLENHPLKLAVTHEAENKVVYLRHVPIPCKHQDIIKPMDKIVCLDAAEAGFPPKGTAIRIADEISLREM